MPQRDFFFQSAKRTKLGLFVSTSLLAITLLVGVVQAQTSYQEAPQLAQRVAAGELPPVEERLPDNPVVVPVVERIGDYGGTWRTALMGGDDNAWLSRTIGYEGLIRVTPNWDEIIPNIAESFEVNEDATEFTFRLREGLRWSDGAPYTVDDIVFWYEDVFTNSELTPVQPAWMISGGEAVVVEKVDDHTVKFTFSEPNGLFLQNAATNRGETLVGLPRHYLQQFHPTYNEDNLDALVSEAGAADWAQLFALRNSVWANPELPTMHGWVVTSVGTERLVAERNPYYFKVDPEGNQLPYIDRVVYDHVADVEVLVLRAMAGEIDMMDRHLATIDNRAILVDNMERGDYRFFETIPDSMNYTVISFNLTHKDPVMREIFQNKDFRIGMSHAINRQEIIDLIYIGQGVPFQVSPRPGTPFYNERLATQYTEYDVDLANEYLDRAGYAERDAEGFRLGPDGQRISFVFEITPGIGGGYGQQATDSLELVQMYWREVGIDMQIRVIDRSLLDTRVAASEHDVTAWFGSGGVEVVLGPHYYFPERSTPSRFAILWAHWYQGDPRGEEPPAAPRRQMELYDQLKATADPERQTELFHQLLEIAADEFYALGIGLNPNGYGIVRNNFRNVPDIMPESYLYDSPAPSNPSQYFIEGGN